MHVLSSLPIAGLLILSPPAHADFSVLDQRPQAAAVEPASQAQPDQPHHSHPERKLHAHPKSDPSAPATARGFGTKIPLWFAVRQIAPHDTSVTFGKHVDRTALVDWQGGRQWPKVLRAAIHPIGLRLILHPHSATITQ